MRILVVATAVLVFHPLLAFSQSFGSVTFSCQIQKENSVDQPSTVRVKFRNGDDKPLAVRFDIQLKASNGAVTSFDSEGASRVNSGTTGEVTVAPFNEQQAVNHSAVIATDCVLTNITVCPALPPENWDSSTYYSPFNNGVGCTQGGRVGPLTLDVGAPKASPIDGRVEFVNTLMPRTKPQIVYEISGGMLKSTSLSDQAGSTPFYLHEVTTAALSDLALDNLSISSPTENINPQYWRIGIRCKEQRPCVASVMQGPSHESREIAQPVQPGLRLDFINNEQAEQFLKMLRGY